MKEIIDIIQSNELYGCGKFTEIAKGKYDKISTFKEAKEKIKRLWLLRK